MTTERLTEAVKWLREILESDYGGVQEALAEDLGYEGSVVSKILSGTYEGSAANVCAAVEALRTQRIFRQKTLIPTLVTDRIMEGLKFAESARALVVVYGPTRCSKTITLTTWAKESPRRVYVEVPTDCSRAGLVRMLAAAVGIDVAGKRADALRNDLFGKLTKRHTVIIDDAGYLRGSSGSAGPGPIGLVKDLRGQIGCGVVVCMEAHQWHDMVNGPRSHIYAHWLGRVDWLVGIPSRGAFRDEVAAIVKVLVPGADAELIKAAHAIAQDSTRLQALFGDLRKALAKAGQDGRAVTAGDLVKARTLRQKAHDPELWPKE